MAKCELCEKEFSTDSALAQHTKDKHGNSAASSKQDQARPEKAKRKSLKRSNRHTTAIGIVAVAVVLGVGVYFIVAPSFGATPFPCIAEQNYYIHVHPFLQIWIDGKNVSLPGNVGIVQGGSCLEPIHTHDSSGILHVELSQSEANKNWTLGDFFTIWKYTCSVESSQCPVVNGVAIPASSVVFNQTDILGFKADATHQLQLLINGSASSAGPSLNLEANDYCTAARASTAPCSPTAGGDPAWNCVSTTQCGTYPYQTGWKLVITYASTG